MYKLPKVEACIAWATQQGYVGGQGASEEYGKLYSRVMVEDHNTAMYNTRTWEDAPKKPVEELR